MASDRCCQSRCRSAGAIPFKAVRPDSRKSTAAVLTGSDFKDGVIEVAVSGARRQGYATDDVSAYADEPNAYASTLTGPTRARWASNSRSSAWRRSRQTSRSAVSSAMRQ